MNTRNYLNASIIASLTLQEAAGDWNYRDVKAGPSFDVTDPILNLRLREIRKLVDDEDSTNDLIEFFDGWAALNHQGPSKIEVTDSVCAFFGVESLADIKRDMLVAARKARHAGKVMAVAQAVFGVCLRHVENGRSLEGIDLGPIVERVLRENASAAVLLEQVNVDLAVLRSVLTEPRDIRYSPTLAIEVSPAAWEDRVAISRTTRGQTTVNYGADGVSVAVYNQQGCDTEPLSSVQFNNADLEGKMFESSAARH